MRRLLPSALLLAIALPLCPTLGGAGGWSGSAAEGDSDSRKSLFAQSAAQLLAHDFPSLAISYLLLDAGSGALLASRWARGEEPVPPGSLLKPFAALAYAGAHHFRYPVFLCRGEASGCWLPRGHGQVDIASALAYSCNSYFRMLAQNIGREEVEETAREFGLEVPGGYVSGAALIGIGNGWRISPLHLARAYLELSRRSRQPGIDELLAGMAQSGRQGTGAEVDRALKHVAALVKTGTAACTHQRRAPGDGFVVALVPADQPRFLLMVRVHGMPGARAAAVTGKMLARLEEQTPDAN